jgi:hypothetical protein
MYIPKEPYIVSAHIDIRVECPLPDELFQEFGWRETHYEQQQSPRVSSDDTSTGYCMSTFAKEHHKKAIYTVAWLKELFVTRVPTRIHHLAPQHCPDKHDTRQPVQPIKCQSMK